jgi:single-strand DNA-binding protein
LHFLVGKTIYDIVSSECHLVINRGRAMVALNKVLIAGRLTRKPVLRRTPNGISVTDLLVALNREYMTLGGERQQEVCFVDVVVWGKQAESCAQVLDCSSPVLVEGRLQLDVWHAKDGEKRCKLRVAAERVQFLEKKNQYEKIPEAAIPTTA